LTFLDDLDGTSESERVDLVHTWIGESGRAFFTELRRSRPILRTPGPVIVTRYADVQEVLSRETVFSVRLYAPKIDACVGPSMLSRDATVFNERDKSVMKVMLRPEDLPAVETISRRLADDAVMSAGGRLDVVTGLTRRVPVEVCGEYFGFPGPDVDTMMRWSRTANLDMFANLAGDPALHEASVQVGQEMKQHVDDLIARRRAGPPRDDILARLLATTFPDAIGFDDERVRTNVIFLLVGGVETTSAASVLILDELLRRPEQLAAAQAAARADDHDLLDRYIWEALRLNPIFPFVVRYCEEDYTLASGTDRETRVPAGTAVYAAIGSALFDEDELDDPESFRLDRPEHHLNLHWGYGHHLCLCYVISKVEVSAIVGALLRREGLRRADGLEGQVDTRGGPFPERFVLEYDASG
jgi:cytochrome P450